MWTRILLLVSCLFAATVIATSHEIGHLLPQYSFKPPYTAGKEIKGWDYEGKTKTETDFIRLTPNELLSMGIMTNSNPLIDDSLDLTLEYRIHSPEERGADGMVLWLTTAPIKAGNTFGGPENWKGLALIFDTYDNNGEDPHPYVMLHTNNGTQEFEFMHDGSSTFVTGCHVPYRNAERSLFRLVIEDSIVSMQVDADGSGTYKRCGQRKSVALPEKIHFSFSAATGGFSDFHDILSLEVHSLQKKALDVFIPPKCTVTGECENLGSLNMIVETMEAVTENIGHELLKVQLHIENSLSLLGDTKQLASEVVKRKDEVQNMRFAIDNGIKEIGKFKNELTTISSSESTKNTDIDVLTNGINKATKTLKRVQSEQKMVTQAMDIELEVLSNLGSTSIWLYIALILVVLHFVVACVPIPSFGRKQRRREF